MRLWYDVRAACRDVDVNVFFELSRKGHKEMALALCQSCPVRADCLAAATEEEAGSQKFGIRGGLTAEERTRAARKKGPYERRREAKAKAA